MVPARRHLFELNDSPWAPVALRETIVESLSRALAWGRVLDGLVAPFREFLRRCGAREVLDLAAGAGAPAAIFARALDRAGERAGFVLTDLQPHPEAWAALAAAHPGRIDFVAEPVDATRIPPSLGAGRARAIVNAFHHFPPSLAARILEDACAGAPGVFVSEGFERNPLRFAAFAPSGIAALLANPLYAPKRRVQKALLTWATPVAFAASVWDGLVSTLRVYTESELRAMVAPFGGGFDWVYGTYDFAPGGRGYYFYGVRR